jgi:glucose/arabinose dehydrogenase
MKKTIGICLLMGLGLALIFGTLLLPKQDAAAQPSFVWPQIALTEVTSGLQAPVHITHAGDNSNRLFIVEQAGRIRIFKGSLFSTLFLDIRDRVSSGGEQGLLSVAFPPGYGVSKDHFYVYYTRTDGNNQLSRFYLTNDPNVADSNSEEMILTFDHPLYANHNGGQLVFGPDGYLYIGAGDGGGGGDPFGNAQNTDSLLGKILRIDVEVGSAPAITATHWVYLPLISKSDGGNAPTTYRIPESNPFVGQPGYRGEIWALGLRNPWRFSFDRVTNDLYIADVGQSLYEEVDFQVAASPGGENYGWNIMEGFHCYASSSCDQTGLVLPVAEYPHNPDRSITGGFVYRGPAYPSLQGIYFYGDYVSGRIWGLQNEISGGGRVWESKELLSTSHKISTFGEDQSGELYLADYSGGRIYQISAVGP